jgi:hypothetical protein
MPRASSFRIATLEKSDSIKKPLNFKERLVNALTIGFRGSSQKGDDDEEPDSDDENKQQNSLDNSKAPLQTVKSLKSKQNKIDLERKPLEDRDKVDNRIVH